MRDLIKIIRDAGQNPNNFSSQINIVDYRIDDRFLNELKLLLSKKYTGQGDFKDIKVIRGGHSQDVQIVGFKHNEIKIEVARIIDKAKSYKFPDSWED